MNDQDIKSAKLSVEQQEKKCLDDEDYEMIDAIRNITKGSYQMKKEEYEQVCREYYKLIGVTTLYEGQDLLDIGLEFKQNGIVGDYKQLPGLKESKRESYKENAMKLSKSPSLNKVPSVSKIPSLNM